MSDDMFAAEARFRPDSPDEARDPIRAPLPLRKGRCIGYTMSPADKAIQTAALLARGGGQ